MSLGRRKIRVADEERWIFNRMAGVYDARPAYPASLIDALDRLAGPPQRRVGDLGAGIGHLALPLARRGHAVIAVDPARNMLERLVAEARIEALPVEPVHAAVESLPLDSECLDLAVVADALHFMDKELSALEIARTLRPRGALAVITSEFGDTPYMHALRAIVEEETPRRLRAVVPAIVQLFSVCRVHIRAKVAFDDETPLDEPTLERVLRSISFIGPAMNAERMARVLGRVRELPYPRVWARRLTLYSGRRA